MKNLILVLAVTGLVSCQCPKKKEACSSCCDSKAKPAAGAACCSAEKKGS